MKKIILMLVVAVLSAVVIPSLYSAVRVISYPLTVVDAKTGTVTVQWDDGAGGAVANATVLYGTGSNDYTGSMAQSSAGLLNFVPSAAGLIGGVYYFRVSNNADSSWSNEYRLFIGKAGGVGVSSRVLSPNPFSPDLGGLNISYTPESDNKTSVKVNIKAYTMDGKLIRTIIAGGIRTVGTLVTDVWDGKTDMGYFAKNGRYIIQLEVQDSTGKMQYLDTAIMVK